MTRTNRLRARGASLEFRIDGFEQRVASFVHVRPSMLKPFATSGFALSSLVAAALIAVACSSESKSEFVPDTDAGLQDGPISSIVPDGSVPEGGLDATGGVKCDVKIASDYKAPTFKPATVDGTACTAQEVTDYWDACLKEPAKTEKDGSCAAWKAAHKKCGDCAEPTDNSGPIQWHSNRNVITVNLGACIAIKQNKPAAGDCGESIHNTQTCRRDACLYCLPNPPSTADYENYEKCVAASATAGVCASYKNVQDTACTGINTAGAPTLACLKDGAENFDVHEKRVIAIFCSQ